MKKINLGSGYKRYPDHLNIDADPKCKPDILLNLDDTNLSIPLPDNSVDHVIAEHVLEHIGAGYFRLLQEIHRICTPGAIIDIRVPHPNHETFLNDPTHKRPVTVEGLRLFSKTYNQLEIERGGSSSTLGLMYDVDFEIVAYNYIYDSFYDNILPRLTREQAERLLREALNTTIEIEIRLMAVK